MNTFEQTLEESRRSGCVTPAPDLLSLEPSVAEVVRTVNAQGFRALVVGGAVRDALLGANPKDVDIEVYGATLEQLTDALAGYRLDLVGKSFGVIKVNLGGGVFLDLSVPRRDNRTGTGHRDFVVTFDPTITPREAAGRRDFTLNAMGYDPETGELHDYYGGLAHLQARVLEATTEAYKEDALRVLRGMQFVGRFGLTATQRTLEMSREMRQDFAALPVERLYEEWLKLAAKAKHPKMAMEFLQNAGWLSLFPEVAALVGVPQDPEWHPEGDAWVHTLFVMEAAVEVAERENLCTEDRVTLLLSALTHDLGKPSTTVQREKKGEMRWTAYGHEAASVPLAKNFLTSVGMPKSVIEKVLPLVANHMAPHMAKDGVSTKQVRKLSERCAPSNIAMLALLCESDSSGRPPLAKGRPVEVQRLLDKASEQQVVNKPMERLVKGQDLLDRGMAPSPVIGDWVRRAWDAQMENKFSTREESQDWLDTVLPRVNRRPK